VNDQVWALIVGAITVIVLRVVDFYLPKGYHSKWAHTHGVRDETEDEEDEPPKKKRKRKTEEE